MQQTKRTPLVWFILILFSVGILVSIFSLIPLLIGFSNLVNSILGLIGLGLIILGLLFNSIFVYKLYKFSSDILRWVNIAFGYGILMAIFPMVLKVINGLSFSVAILLIILTVLIRVVVWTIVYKYIVNLQKRA